MAKHTEALTESRLTIDEAGQSAQRVFGEVLKALGDHAEAPDEWEVVVRQVMEMERNGIEMSAEQAASHLASGLGETFAEMALERRIAWEAVARHLCHLISQYDMNDNLADIEAAWPEWARGKRSTVTRESL